MALALQGGALFAFIPLVLYLFLRQPLGPGPSLAAGMVLMLGHRFVAEPWAARHAGERCFWCGKRPAGAAARRLEIRSGRRTWRLAACGEDHARSAARFVTFAARWRGPLMAGIFAPLFVLLAATSAEALGRPVMGAGWAALQFRMIVATTVVGASIGYLTVRDTGGPLLFPFPLHNLFLLGIRATLWVFRLVGTWWLVAGLVRLATS